jgi:hypothetical protein
VPALESLLTVGTAWEAVDLDHGAPRPEPIVRIMPRV